MKKSCITTLFCILAMTFIHGQENAGKNVMKEGTIQEQFDYVTDNSNRYKGGDKNYRVVREELLNQLSANVDKEIDELEEALGNSNTTIETQLAEIASLKDELKARNDDLQKANTEKNNMAFLGTIPMKKAAYRTIMWAIIAGLTAVLLFFIFSFIRSNVVTRQTSAKLEQMREEFDAFRKKSMEDDQKLRRQLQDEINKHL